MPLVRDKQQGFKEVLTPVLKSGMYPNVQSKRVPLWSTATNVHFTEFGLEKAEGRVTLVTLGA